MSERAKAASMFARLALVWTHFVWAAAGGHSHGAVVLPVTIEGARHSAFMQLDTGAPYNFIYVEAAQTLGLHMHVKKVGSAQEPGCTNAFVPMVFTVAFHRERTLACAISYSGGSPIVGTIGLTTLAHRTLIVDFPNQRLALSGDGSALEHATYTPFSALTEPAHVIVAARLGNQNLQHVIYDTGSSSIPLALRLHDWLAATGRTVADQRNTHLRGSAWSKPVDIVCAPTMLNIQIAGKVFAHVTACTVVSGPPSASVPGGIDAVIGNALFEKKTVILDFKNHRFGLIP